MLSPRRRTSQSGNHLIYSSYFLARDYYGEIVLLTGEASQAKLMGFFTSALRHNFSVRSCSVSSLCGLSMDDRAVEMEEGEGMRSDEK